MSQTKTRRVTFAAKVREQTMVLVPEFDVTQGGRVVGSEPGQRIHFKDGYYSTDDPVVIERIRARLAASDAPDGVYEISAQAVAPDPTDTLVALATANAEQTRALLDEERDTFERPAVIAACEAKLAQFGTRGPKPRTD